MAFKTPIAIIGATGYTGTELLRILLTHPKAHIVSITSRQHEGVPLHHPIPAFTGLTDLCFEALHVKKISRKVKVTFLCLPHHESMEVAQQFRSQGVRVIDLSADFRLQDAQAYEQWYGPHTQKKLLAEAVYGLPEIFRNEIKDAKLVASPGCYPTSIALGLAPLLTRKMVSLEGIICDSKSGVSGAGRTAKVESLFSEVNDDFKAYHIGKHRHTPEIEQTLSHIAGEPMTILFAPHLIPMDRGIESTIYCKPLRRWSTADLIKTYQQFYKKERFVKILLEGKWPSTKQVRSTNYCHIGLMFEPRTDRIVISSVIDNLTKGASGQAMQSFNLMMGYPEAMGLDSIGMIP